MLENVLATMSRIEEIKSNFRSARAGGVVSVAPHAASSPGLARRTDSASGFGAYLAKPVVERAKGSVQAATAYDPLIEAASARHGLDAALLKAVVQAESGFNENAVSPAGAQGLMQLMPSTASALGVADPFDPAQSIDAGARYLKQQLDRFGDVTLALAAYNAGPNAVAKYRGVPPFRETQNYVTRVLSYRDDYQRQ